MHQTADILRLARARLDSGSWAQRGDFRSSRICPWMAIHQVEAHYAWKDWAVQLLAKAVGGGSEVDLFRFSDAPERTLSQVHAAFDRAIALAER